MLFVTLSLLSLISLNLVDTFIDLLNMLIDGNRVLGLTNDFQKIFVGKEEESWEHSSLGSQQIVQLLLHDFKLDVKAIECVNETNSVFN